MKIVSVALTGALLSMAIPASAAITIDFEGLVSGVSVNQYYYGGTASDGTSTFNAGVNFINFRTAGNIGSPASTIAFNSSAPAVVGTVFQFGALSFDYGFRQAGTVNVYSGMNGSGTLLGTATFAANTSAAASPFTKGMVLFSGLAQSFTLVGTNGTLGLDNITFDLNAASGVPEPATWAMMMLGFGGMAYAMRRKGKVSTRIRFA